MTRTVVIPRIGGERHLWQNRQAFVNSLCRVTSGGFVRIALLEDESAQAMMMKSWLQEIGNTCDTFASGRAMLSALSKEPFDLLILDWNLPDISGTEVLQWVRKNIQKPIPVLFVTSRNEELDIVQALKAGADDYMIKPVGRMELVARLDALARRAGILTRPMPATLLKFNSITVDTEQRTVSCGGEIIELARKEYDLALYLLQHQGQLIARTQLMESLWGLGPDINTRTVDTHVSRVRRKLQLTPEHGWKLSTIYHFGYRLELITSHTAA